MLIRRVVWLGGALLVVTLGVAIANAAPSSPRPAGPAGPAGPAAVPPTVPPTVPGSVPGDTVPGGSVPPTTVLAPALGPLIPIPPGCTGPAPASAVFIGELVALNDPDKPTAVRYQVQTLLAGSLQGYLINQTVDVRYGDEARFLEVGSTYVVGVRPDDTGLLISTARSPLPLFGGDAVIGINDTDTECPNLEDPVRTLLADGTSVETGVLSPLQGHSGDVLFAFVKPLLLALGALVLLVLLKLLFFSFARETRARARMAREREQLGRSVSRGWSQPS